MKQRIYALMSCLTGSILIVVLLYAFSILESNNPNGFVRALPSHKVVGIISIDIKYNSWYLAGSNKNSVFLGNSAAPSRVLKVDSSLQDTTGTILSKLEKFQIYKGARLYVEYPSFYIMDGIQPSILKGNLVTGKLERLVKTYFTAGIPLTKNSFALRSIYPEVGNRLIKQSIIPDSLKMTNILEKQVDGVFCTDGEMTKVPGSSKIIYLYYYRNQFLCTDSNLNLLYKGKTIDTISHAHIKIAKIISTGETTMAAPPLYVNKRVCANEKYLFVQSALRANNETDYMVKDVSIIDVYMVKDGKYQFSLYLPDFKGNKIRDFKVYGQSLYALYDHYLYKYQLNF